MGFCHVPADRSAASVSLTIRDFSRWLAPRAPILERANAMQNERHSGKRAAGRGGGEPSASHCKVTALVYLHFTTVVGARGAETKNESYPARRWYRAPAGGVSRWCRRHEMRMRTPRALATILASPRARSRAPSPKAQRSRRDAPPPNSLARHASHYNTLSAPLFVTERMLNKKNAF